MPVGYVRDSLRDLNTPAHGNVPGLDALRTAAILLVVMVHTQERVGSHLPLVGAGWTGVDLFFVLSGYLIGRQLWKEAQSGGIRIGRFLLRRGLRIWPLYFFSALVIWGVHGGGVPWADLLCVSNYFHHIVDGGWSLSTEEQFYILAPLLLTAGLAFVRARRLLAIPLAFLVVLPLVRWLMIGGGREIAAFNLIYQPLYSHADGLAAGFVLAWISVFRPNLTKRSGWIPNLTIVAGGGSVSRSYTRADIRFSSAHGRWLTPHWRLRCCGVLAPGSASGGHFTGYRGSPMACT